MKPLLALALLLGGCAGEGGSGMVPALSSQEETADTAAPTVQPRTVACAAAEETIFTCKVANGRRISVCADENERTFYRFGGDRLELEIEGGEWAQVAYSGGGEAQIAFANAGTRYIVFSRMVRTNFAPGEPNDPAISDGVIVLDGAEVAGLRLCRDPDTVPVQYDLAERHFTRVEELFTYEAERADRDE
ncbi:MAG: hypothetical protein JJ901_05710 [Erythrobacter sp.]|uniref:hypothetical protein n=1 Tax=Erythrobacter sp. TaxID=1042 RepID=UPI001B153B47|nr:hypothetical protein [Erythrobacter sp.]MBO6767785.1 hypothetical protein [Erythrobacter sp.]